MEHRRDADATTMKTMRSISACLALTILSGCIPKYGEETQLSITNGTHPVWAIAPAVNLSGESAVDPLLQADLVYHQLGAVNNVTLIPVNRVIQVYAALHITQVESEEQAQIVCEQLGCDALIVPTITIYDPYNPPKFGAALQLMRRVPMDRSNNIDPRDLIRQATPQVTEPLPTHPKFIQVIGMYDAANGSVRDAVWRYARGRNDPTGPMGQNEYLLSMDRYCGFVYYTLIQQMIGRVQNQPAEPAPAVRTAQINLTAQGG
jgi:hypothetical protein